MGVIRPSNWTKWRHTHGLRTTVSCDRKLAKDIHQKTVFCHINSFSRLVENLRWASTVLGKRYPKYHTLPSWFDDCDREKGNQQYNNIVASKKDKDAVVQNHSCISFDLGCKCGRFYPNENRKSGYVFQRWPTEPNIIFPTATGVPTSHVNTKSTRTQLLQNTWGFSICWWCRNKEGLPAIGQVVPSR